MSNAQNAEAAGLGKSIDTKGLYKDIASMENAELVQRFRFSVGHFDPRVFHLEDEMLDRAWLAEGGVGKWPIRVLLGHLADTELVMSARVRKAASEPGSVLSLWDQDAPIDAGVYGAPGEGCMNKAHPPIGAFVASVYTVRQWIGEWLSGLEDSVWENRVLHPDRGELSLRDLVVMSTWHLEHHAVYLNLKIEKMIGPRPVEESCEQGGGCGKNECACEQEAARAAEAQ